MRGEYNLKKPVTCLKCGVKLDRTDWEILKYHNKLPICDECELGNLEEKDIPVQNDSKLRLVE
jgi:NAD-dependent SIR2 family protein deacetylase